MVAPGGHELLLCFMLHPVFTEPPNCLVHRCKHNYSGVPRQHFFRLTGHGLY